LKLARGLERSQSFSSRRQAKCWKLVNGFYKTDHNVLTRLIEADALVYAREHNIMPRSCK
jgi:hypothetical protein